jgi:hypothetical protein
MEPTALRLIVRPWSDPVIDVLGHDARSTYVERFWLGILGPSTTWFLRLVAGHLDREPDGFDLDLGEAARSLGLGSPLGRHSPLQRAVRRTVQFGLARTVGREGLDVRRRIPPLNRGQVARLPESLQGAHRDWQEALLRPTSVEESRRRARRLALSLLETGHDLDGVERELHRWRYHPALASEAVAWARDRHRAALRAAARQA